MNTPQKKQRVETNSDSPSSVATLIDPIVSDDIEDLDDIRPGLEKLSIYVEQTLDRMSIAGKHCVSSDIMELKDTISMFEGKLYEHVHLLLTDDHHYEMLKSVEISKISVCLMNLHNIICLYIDRVHIGMRGLASLSATGGKQITEMSIALIGTPTKANGLKRKASDMSVSPCSSPTLERCMTMIAESGKMLTMCTLNYAKSKGLYITLKNLRDRVKVMQQHCAVSSAFIAEVATLTRCSK
uniref:Uncharacterized protein n=1 Tax=viral metagenome TaxID=1070528 RepID=A0A2V0R9Q6_9ZZZZ